MAACNAWQALRCAVDTGWWCRRQAATRAPLRCRCAALSQVVATRTDTHAHTLSLALPLCLALTQTLMVKELFKLARHAQAERRLPGFRAQQWCFFLVATFWVYIR